MNQIATTPPRYVALHEWPTSDDPKHCYFSRWWHAMGEIFGRPWYDQNGPEPGEIWRNSLQQISMDSAALVLEHYRKAGRTFPPNQSEVMNLAYALHKTNTKREAIPFTPQEDAREVALRDQQAKVEEWVGTYQSKHPEASRRDAYRAYWEAHGLVKKFPNVAPPPAEREAIDERHAIQEEGAGT